MRSGDKWKVEVIKVAALIKALHTKNHWNVINMPDQRQIYRDNCFWGITNRVLSREEMERRADS